MVNALATSFCVRIVLISALDMVGSLEIPDAYELMHLRGNNIVDDVTWLPIITDENMCIPQPCRNKEATSVTYYVVCPDSRIDSRQTMPSVLLPAQR